MRKTCLIIMAICFLIEGCRSNEEGSSIDNTTESPTIAASITEWSVIAEEPDKYVEIMILLGENFESNVFEAEDYPGFDEEELTTVEELYKYYQEHNCLPENFQTTFTEFSKANGYDYFGIDTEKEGPLYEALSNSFEIGYSASEDTYHIDIKGEENEAPTIDSRYDQYGYITAEDPYVLTFDDCTYDVGNCTFTLTEIRITTSPFKVGSTHHSCRLFLTVKNNSNSQTEFAVRKTGNLAGNYYESTGKIEYIGGNSAALWSTDKDSPLFDNVGLQHTIPAKATKEICVQLGYVTTDKLQFTDEPQFDFYFTNEDDLFVLFINKPE